MITKRGFGISRRWRAEANTTRTGISGLRCTTEIQETSLYRYSGYPPRQVSREESSTKGPSDESKFRPEKHLFKSATRSKRQLGISFDGSPASPSRPSLPIDRKST